jgi:hypothetical protein
MKKGFLSFTAFLFALAAVPQAQAIVGGPFDNGDYSQTLDNNGIYQAAFRFPNGSGFAQFGTNVDMTTYVDISTAGGTGVRSSVYSILNRSLIYYKGVTYLGTASGMVDHERKTIQGYTNGNSDVRTTAATNTGGGGNQNQTAATQALMNNGGLNFPCNTNWKAKITTTHPVLRFSGTGELTVLNPSLDQVAYAAITAIINSQQNAGGTNQAVGPQISAIIAAIAAAQASDVIPSTDSVKDNSDTVKITVFGSRQFFLGRRL